MTAQDEFRQRLDEAILAGHSSEFIAREFQIRSETVRKRRKMLRYAGRTPMNRFEASDARRKPLLKM